MNRALNTHTFGSETFNIPCSARYGSFSLSSSRLTYSGPEPGRGEPIESSTVSKEPYTLPDPQITSTAVHKGGTWGIGSGVATLRCSRLGKVRKVLRNNESDQGAPIPSDAMVRDRTRGITRFSLRKTVGKASISRCSGEL